MTGIIMLICAVTGLAMALSDGPVAKTPGLIPKKVAELKSIGVSFRRYTELKKQGREHELALRNEPPPDPNVVGPRLIREAHSSELTAWKSYLEQQFHTAIHEKWNVQQLIETRTVVTQSFVVEASNNLTSARWLVKIALDRPLTEPEQDLVSNSKWSEALNEDARKLESFPKPQAGPRLPIQLLAFEGLSPGRHEVIVKIQPADRYEPSLIVRAGVFDEALLRGKTLVKSVPLMDSTLRLAKNVRIYEQNLDHGAAGPARRSSIYRLSSLFNKEGPVSLLLGWRTGAKGLRGLLRQPVQELTIITF